eukprot:11310806-Prorocentrum_lima.AAC.1
MCQRLIDEELTKRDDAQQALMNQRVGSLQQQLVLAREAVDKERERADRLQVQPQAFSPVCLGSGAPPAPVQRTHGSVIQANSL